MLVLDREPKEGDESDGRDGGVVGIDDDDGCWRNSGDDGGACNETDADSFREEKGEEEEEENGDGG